MCRSGTPLPDNLLVFAWEQLKARKYEIESPRRMLETRAFQPHAGRATSELISSKYLCCHKTWNEVHGPSNFLKIGSTSQYYVIQSSRFAKKIISENKSRSITNLINVRKWQLASLSEPFRRQITTY
jgi:hypothetical protein